MATTNLLTSGRLNAYLADIDRQAQERFERLREGMKQAQGITCLLYTSAPKMGRPNEKEVKATEMILEMLKDGEMLSSHSEVSIKIAACKQISVCNPVALFQVP